MACTCTCTRLRSVPACCIHVPDMKTDIYGKCGICKRNKLLADWKSNGKRGITINILNWKGTEEKEAAEEVIDLKNTVYNVPLHEYWC